MSRLKNILEMPTIHGLHYYIRQKDYSRYGIDSNEYIRLLMDQDYKCGCCGKPMG